jgi:hypothetical protein
MGFSIALGVRTRGMKKTKARGLEKIILKRGSVPLVPDPQSAIAQTTDATAEAMAIDESFMTGPEVDLDNLSNDEL